MGGSEREGTKEAGSARERRGTLLGERRGRVIVVSIIAFCGKVGGVGC